MQEFFTPENIGKLIALIVSIASAYKAFSELVSKKMEKLRADYDFAEKFMADGKWERLHDYLLERGYWGLSGTQLDASVIRYFLNQKDPLGQLSDYTRGLRYLELQRNDSNQVLAIVLIRPLDKPIRYKWKEWRVFFAYFIFAFLSLGPVIFLPNFLAQGLSGVAGLVAWVLSFGMLAYLNLDELAALHSAKRVAQKNAATEIKSNTGAVVARDITFTKSN